jgi:hypothetical protein
MNWLLIEQLLMQILPVVFQSVDAVAKATGKPPAAAVAEVVDHLTPGAPASPTLSETAAK